jgi:hypothetical protein
MPLAGFLSVVLLVDSMNWWSYGVFRNNELRSGPFVTAYGALARIKHDEWKRYVVLPRDARQRAYSVSPAARELAPYLEGDAGKRWVVASQGYPKPWGCAGQPTSCNNEILSGWLVWALRDAVATAGHYRTAREADDYYERLAGEINAACDRQAIPCRDRRDTLAPVWRGHYTRDTLAASAGVLATLIQLNHGQIGVPRSALTAEQATIFRQTIHGPLSGVDDADATNTGIRQRWGELRTTLARHIAAGYATASPSLFAASLVSYVFVLVAWLGIKSAAVSGNAIAVLTGLLVAVVSRVGLLGFLEATSIPSNNLLYLLPVVPIYLLFVVSSIASAAFAVLAVVRYRRLPS